MPRSKNPDMYPQAIPSILRAAVDNSAGIHPSFPTKQAAMKMRAQIYAYINALSARESEALGYLPDGSVSNMYRQIQITPEGAVLHLLDKQFTPEVQALTAALQSAGVETPLSRDARIEAAMTSPEGVYEPNDGGASLFHSDDPLGPRTAVESDRAFEPAVRAPEPRTSESPEAAPASPPDLSLLFASKDA